MPRFGADPNPRGRRFGLSGKGRSGRKGKRKWIPEPGTAGDWGSPAQTNQPLRPATKRMPVEPYPPAPFTADDAPTGAVSLGHPTAEPTRGGTPTPPPWPESDPTGRTQARRPTDFSRSTPPPGTPPPPSYRPSDQRGHSAGYPFAGDHNDYERYGTDGYPRGTVRPQPPGPGEPGPAQSTDANGANNDPNAGSATDPGPGPGSVPRLPKKLTVTRVAALRSRELGGRAVDAFHRATKADGAEKSGLTSLTYATMLNYASDAAMAVALANTLFFSPTSADSSKGKIALFLLITIAPFALVAPVIGPALDRIQRGRRLAMCAASAGQALMCVLMALHFNDWALYPAALGKLVLSKSFMVLKAAVTPRVLPPEITLSKTNARLTVFGLAAGGVFGAIASGFSWAFDSAGALWFTAAICGLGAVQAMRIPSWVEVTEGEVPASLSKHPERKKRQPMGRHIVVALWANGTIRVLTGFLMMFAAFAVKAHAQESGQGNFAQLVLLGIIAGAAGLGGFVGNGLGSRLHLGRPDQIVLACIGASLSATLLATLFAGVATAAIVGLVGATCSALAKISLDAVIQQDLPEESRASAFGRSETVLQLAWCFGGAIGLLLPPTYWLGFLVVSILLAVGLCQTYLVRKGSSLVPGLGGDRPLRPERTGNGNGASRGPAPSPR